MRFLSLAVAAACASVATALSNPFSPIPGYPLGNGVCLTDQQATFIVNTYAGALAYTNAATANATLQVLLAKDYAEQSDSIDILAGFPLGTVTFPTKQIYIASIINSPPNSPFVTLQIFHDCVTIGWRWRENTVGSAAEEVNGINVFTANPLTGQLSSAYVEFNSIAYGRDIGWTCTPPPGQG